ncbi:MAG: ABC transporter permease [Vicinamibacterales bacterium]
MDWLRSAGQDVRYAVRTLLGSPTFTAVAVISLALGIGATTAIFSAVNATLLRPLPYSDASQLIDVRTRMADGRVTSGLVSSGEIAAFAGQSSVVQQIAGYVSQPFDASLIRDDGRPESVVACGVTNGFFELLGVPIVAGRAFTQAEHVEAGRDAPVGVILSDSAWTRLFGRDPAVIGRTIRLAEIRAATTVVGVAAPVLDLPHGVDIYFNVRSSTVGPGAASHSFTAVARLTPGTTMPQLQSAGNAALLALARTEPTAVGREFVLRPLAAAVVGDLAPILLIVLGASAVLLALACVNVTNLLLARGMSRTREMAMRAALGAGPGRLVQQLLTESVVLAAAAALLGAALAGISIATLRSLRLMALPRLETIPLDGTILAFGILVVAVCGLVVGILPAWRLARIDGRTLLNDNTRSATAGVATSRLMSGLIVAEVALAVSLVAGAGWLVQGFQRLRDVDAGFVAERRLVVDVRPTRDFADQDAAYAWADALEDQVRAVDGVAATGSGAFPLRSSFPGTTSIEITGEAPNPAFSLASVFRVATPGFFDAMGIRPVSGRTFTVDDRRTSVPVAVVNRAFVARYVRDRDPLRATFAYGFPIERDRLVQIVGVVDDVRYKSLVEPDEPAFYVPVAQTGFPFTRRTIVVAATSGPPDALIPPLRDALARFDPQLIATFTTASSIVATATARQQLGMLLMLVFGTTALVLAGVGVYGVIAYAAQVRRRELATRIALGATRGQVFRLMMGRGQRLALWGELVGLSLAYAVGRVLSSYVFAVQAEDPLILATAGAVVAGVSLLATVIPAVRASRIDPVGSLR